MSHPQRARERTALAYAIADDDHWSTAGATRVAGALALPERRATRTNAGTPYNLSVYDLALDHDQALAEFAKRHGRDLAIPTGRTALADYAASLAESNEAARVDYEQLRLTHDLRAALTIGDAEGLLGKLECPGCLCWSLVGTRNLAGGWAATCRVQRCATEPGQPRVFTLAAVVRHHLARRDAAAA
ncbi:hypothetical protein [Streptomyces scabiei]|uniref:hypothetical protein n=1 Tax=Streptomyces scabiei TaxID=1930 RepID=UPI0029BEB17C|nr:hypothetical protein [Streptomyces scabiei]MDX3125331.1 hypothetical protein [Streptomyces scabiei]MDX3202808.1 hypothetical protein [Streptomyces scabiei]MDX3223172.1 hypothetical protein [Streptomyces scabiei]